MELVCCSHPRKQEIQIKMAQFPQNIIAICDQNSKTLQGWHKPKYCSRKQESLPYPSVKSRSAVENFITINNTKFPDTDENHHNF
jgi:hypothetical protein